MRSFNVNNIEINDTDSKEEKKCKRIFNVNYFGVFRKDYEKFRRYSILNGSYSSMTYKSDVYDYWYIKKNYPEFISC
jgi:hypothetical protein